MTGTTLDVRDVPPAERHPMIHDAFEELAAGNGLFAPDPQCYLRETERCGPAPPVDAD